MTEHEEEYYIVDPMKYNKHGWIRDRSDIRDHCYVPVNEKKIDRVLTLRDNMPKVLDQGQLGSCTANGICNTIVFAEMKEGIDDGKPRSRLFVYYNERNIEGNVDEDSGAQIRDGIKSVNKLGACFEDTWPYDITQFTEKPSEAAYNEAKQHKTVKYERVKQDIDHIKDVLVSGYPIVFGFVVFDSIRLPSVNKTGIIPMPKSDSTQIGGHCVILTGYDDNKRLFQIMNSWGEEWGDKGYGYLSYDYVLNSNLASDFWKITLVK